MPTPSQHAFSEKVALITDGTNPIGRAVAMQLALYGCFVIVGYPKSSDIESNALSELKSLGTLASAVEANVSTVEGAQSLVGEVENLYGRLDLLVNCVKWRSGSTFDSVNEEIFDQAIDSNLKSVFLVTQEACRVMNPRPKPKIVNVMSAVDSEETRADVAFSVSNEAIAGLTKSLAINLPDKFRVNAVAVSEKAGSVSKFDELDAELFRPKAGIDPDDVARSVLYLLSSEATGVNGQILKVE